MGRLAVGPVHCARPGWGGDVRRLAAGTATCLPPIAHPSSGVVARQAREELKAKDANCQSLTEDLVSPPAQSPHMHMHMHVVHVFKQETALPLGACLLALDSAPAPLQAPIRRRTLRRVARVNSRWDARWSMNTTAGGHGDARAIARVTAAAGALGNGGVAGGDAGGAGVA